MHRCCNEYTGKKSVPHIQEAHAFTDGAGAFSGGLNNSTVWLKTILKSNVENVNEGEEAQEHSKMRDKMWNNVDIDRTQREDVLNDSTSVNS